MINDKIKKFFKKKTSQLRLTQLTFDLSYETKITQQKGKQDNSRSSRPNNSMLNDENKKNKKDPKSNLN